MPLTETNPAFRSLRIVAARALARASAARLAASLLLLLPLPNAIKPRRASIPITVVKCHLPPWGAGIVYDVWKGDGGKAITSFAIVTTEAAPSVAQYHNRMPVVLDDSQFDGWVRDTPDQAAALMKPYAGAIEAWEVGAEVGNVRNNQPELMERVGLL